MRLFALLHLAFSNVLHFYNYLAHVSLVTTINTYPQCEQIKFMFVREDILSRMLHLRFQRCTYIINLNIFTCVFMHKYELFQD